MLCGDLDTSVCSPLRTAATTARPGQDRGSKDYTEKDAIFSLSTGWSILVREECCGGSQCRDFIKERGRLGPVLSPAPSKHLLLGECRPHFLKPSPAQERSQAYPRGTQNQGENLGTRKGLKSDCFSHGNLSTKN